MFYDKDLMNSKSLGKVWRIGHGLNEESDEVSMANICDKLDLWVDSTHEETNRRLSLRTSSVFVDGAARLYKRKLELLFDDAKRLEHDMSIRKKIRGLINNESNISQTFTDPELQVTATDSDITVPNEMQAPESSHTDDTSTNTECVRSNQNTSSEFEGPYKSTMTSLTHCPKTTLPLQTRNPSLVLRTRFVNTTKTTNLIVGTFTVTRSIKNLTMIAVSYKWEMGKWKTYSTLPRLSCNSPGLVTVVAMMSNFKFDLKDCTVIKGTYQIQFDINVADHVWAPEREYGRTRWKLEFVTKKNTIACLYGENIVEPIKKLNKTILAE